MQLYNLHFYFCRCKFIFKQNSMKYLIIVTVSFAFLLMGHNYHLPDQPEINNTVFQQVLDKKRIGTVRCTPDWNTFNLTSEEIQQMIPLPGTGTHGWKIS